MHLENFLPVNCHSLMILIDAQLSTLPCESCDVKMKRSWRIQISRVCAVMKNLDVHKAVGPDYISPRTLQNCNLELSHLLTILFCRICRSGIFPTSWKVARVMPIFKNRGSLLTPHFTIPCQLCLHWQFGIVV